MFEQIDRAKQAQYNNNVALVAQQRLPKFAPHSTSDNYKGNDGVRPKTFFDKREAVPRVTRGGSTPIAETNVTPRFFGPEHFGVPADLLGETDLLETAIEFNSSYQQTQVAAANRRKDRIWLEQFFGPNRIGREGLETVEFDSAMSVPAGSVGMTVEKMIDAQQLFLEQDVDWDNEEFFLALPPASFNSLLNQMKATNRDYTGSDTPLAKGVIRHWMGFNIIVSNKIQKNDAGEYRCPVWAKSGMHVGTWGSGVRTRISERDDADYALQIYTTFSFNATRLEECKCGEILCKET